jgi:prepilin-type N-terminal cleavage/methylation domain-containing protein
MGGKAGAKGFTLVETLVASGIIAITAFFIAQYSGLTKSRSRAMRVKSVAQMISFNVQRLIQNDADWNLTLYSISNNSQLRCLRSQGNVATNASCQNADVSGGIEVFRAPIVNVPYYSTRNPTQGFNMDAEPCTGFSERQGSPDCPFRVELDLELQCLNGCNLRNLNIKSRLLYRPGPSEMVQNFVGVNFEENRLLPLVIDDSNCTDHGGTFDDATRTCRLPTRSVACADPNQVMYGFQDGDPLCRNP